VCACACEGSGVNASLKLGGRSAEGGGLWGVPLGMSLGRGEFLVL